MAAVSGPVSAPLLDVEHDEAVADVSSIHGVAVVDEADVENPSTLGNLRLHQRTGPVDVAFRLLCVALVVVQTARMGLLVQDRVSSALHGNNGSVSQLDAEIQFLADHSEPSITREEWDLGSDIPWPWGNHTHHHDGSAPAPAPSDDPDTEVYKELKDFKSTVDKGFGTANIVATIIAAFIAFFASLDMCCKIFGGRSVYWSKESVVYMKAKRKPLLTTLGVLIALALATTVVMWCCTSKAVKNPDQEIWVTATKSLFVVSRTFLNILGLVALYIATVFYACGGLFVQGSRLRGTRKYNETKAWRMKLYLDGMTKARPDISPRIMSLFRRGILVEA